MIDTIKIVFIFNKKICKDNVENQNCFFEFLPILYKHIVKYPKFTEVLTQLISKNPFFLEDFNKVRIVHKRKSMPLLVWLIQKISTSVDDKIPFKVKADILNLLATSCSFGVQAIFANQEIIFKALLA